MILNIWDNVTEFADNVKTWLMNNDTNPALWIGLFFLGIMVFVITYRALNKEG